MTTFHPVERVSTDDLMSLAAERGSTPMQVGAVLMLDGRQGLDPGSALDAIAHRVTAIPRLRQRLIAVPWGCGRPVWVDDPEFSAASRVTAARCPAPGGEEAVLEVAAKMLVTPLPRDRPLWAAKLVTDAGGGEAALIFVFHHVLADGIGGLAVLSKLVDGATETTGIGTNGVGGNTGNTGAGGFTAARPLPSRSQLAVDAAKDRVRSLGRLGTVARRVRVAGSQLRPAAGMRPARSSLNGPTGPRRTFATVRVDLEQVRSTAHAHQAP
jgi:hypothetical protein